MGKTVVYGLGRKFWQYKDEIEKQYDIVAYCDKNEVDISKFITCQELAENIDMYESVLVTSKRGDIVYYLVQSGIPESKIELYPFEQEYCFLIQLGN